MEPQITVVSRSYTTLMLHGKIRGLTTLLNAIGTTLIDSYDLFRDMIRAVCSYERDIMHEALANATDYTEGQTREWVYCGPVPQKAQWGAIVAGAQEAIQKRIDQLRAQLKV